PYASVMPASFNTLLATSPTARPTPWGAGFSVTCTDALLPVTREGRELARAQPLSHEVQNILILIMFSFALAIERRIDGLNSRLPARPRPPNPPTCRTM